MVQIYTTEELEDLKGNCTDATKIGSGGFGAVYKANFKGNSIAIKASADKSITQRSQWTKEIEALGELRHDHIIRLLGSGEDSDKFYLVYNLMPKCLFNEIEGLNWVDTVKVLRQTATALSHIHGNEYVFGDLKPENILLDKENNVKICDFGTATKDGTKKWVDVGTRAYIAPEGSGTRQSDIYSFGILILQLISKRKKVENLEDSEQEGKQRKGKALAIRDQQIRRWADVICQRKGNGHVVHKSLCETCGHEKAASITKLGLQCSHNHVNARPSITTVIEKLNELEYKLL